MVRQEQTVTARSSCEAQNRALASATCEVMWLHGLLLDLGVDVPLPISIYSDSTAAIAISSNHVYHGRTKHIDMDCHFVKKKVQQCLIKPTYVPSAFQLADLFTKFLPKISHFSLLSKLGVFNPCAPSTCEESIKNNSAYDGTNGVAANCTRHELPSNVQLMFRATSVHSETKWK